MKAPDVLALKWHDMVDDVVPGARSSLVYREDVFELDPRRNAFALCESVPRPLCGSESWGRVFEVGDTLRDWGVFDYGSAFADVARWAFPIRVSRPTVFPDAFFAPRVEAEAPFIGQAELGDVFFDLADETDFHSYRSKNF